MSLYEKKLAKLEQLAGAVDCPHVNAWTYVGPDWDTLAGDPPYQFTYCLDCRVKVASADNAATATAPPQECPTPDQPVNDVLEGL